jgi:hypothetical protein
VEKPDARTIRTVMISKKQEAEQLLWEEHNRNPKGKRWPPKYEDVWEKMDHLRDPDEPGKDPRDDDYIIPGPSGLK